MRRLSSHRSRRLNRQKWSILLISLWFMLWGAIASFVFFRMGLFTIGGIPSQIVFKFLGDRQAIALFTTGKKTELHAHLEAQGFEDDIKAYYRPQLANEQLLDQYIHQLFYNWTGYVGRDYTLSGKGKLVLKRSL